MIRYTIKLSKGEVEELMEIVNKGSHTSQTFRTAYILLNCDEGKYSEKVTNEQISKILKVGMRTIDRVKKKFIDEGFEPCLERRPTTREYEKKTDGDVEAKLVTLCCSDPPKGFAKWSLRLLADKMVELKYVESISHVTVRSNTKKNELKPWKVKGWVIPPEKSSEFVANMEHVLDVYKRPYDKNYPVICMDESPKQLIDETRASIPMRRGQDARVDYEYIRHGVVNIFMANEPLKGKRVVRITEFKTKKDWAIFMKEIADKHYPKAKRITLIMDNFKTHAASSFYETFEPKEAKRLWDRFDFVFTPKHGSWLNMAEIELHVLNGQCLNRHISSIEEIAAQVSAWQNQRNNKICKINWQFTNKEARVKLKRLYPSIEN
ncbi:MAG: IS630 family transposase [Sediminibacterium sp.]|uniref:IS630 family transposase n=1 Tax=Bacteroidota TaxID=976 RepID=UPI0027241C02|nr:MULTISPECIES: IS630 family transposase [Bacteroidota]MDO8997319.1 IS630 family transposase [Sediminibacterium sp.]MDP2412328.1 IS630 family transposase [Daejeonella sp.]